MKGASDTMTKLFWNCQVKLPAATSQTIVLGRFFHLFAVAFHRMNHVATAKTDLGFYSSLFHFRNSRNVAWPFRRTLDELTTWMIKEIEKATATASSNDVPLLAIQNLVPMTPPRSARDNPRAAFEEERHYSVVTGATPGRGRPKYPKHKTSAWFQDQSRLKTCVGLLYMAAEKKRGKCFLCNVKTRFFCVLCKRWYCVESQDETLKDLIAGDNDVTKFLDGKRPPATIRMKSTGFDGAHVDVIAVENSCFHIVHQKTISERVSSDRAVVVSSSVASSSAS